jgi:hypothetical protein
MNEIQHTSRFPDINHLSDKGILTRNLERMRRHHPSTFKFYPPSFRVPYQRKELDLAHAEARAEADAIGGSGRQVRH